MRYFCNSMNKLSKKPLESVHDTIEEAIKRCKSVYIDSVYAYVATYNEEANVFNVVWEPKNEN